MGGVDAAEFRGLRGQRDEFFRAREGSGSVLKGRGHANCAVLHGLAHQRAHLLEFRGVRLPAAFAEYNAPDLRCSDIAREIDAHALFLEAGEVLPEASPIRNDFVMGEDGSVCLQEALVQRCDGVSLTGDLGGDALENFGREVRIDEHRKLRLSEHVDKARRDHKALCIDYFRGGGGI